MQYGLHGMGQRENRRINRGNLTKIAVMQLMAMRDVMQGDENNPKVPMENNCRLQMPINSRVVRTNINFRSPVSEQTSRLQENIDLSCCKCMDKNEFVKNQSQHVNLSLIRTGLQH